MQDTEFTVEEGRLYMLQTRNAKRPAQAAVRFAFDAVQEGLLTPAEAINTIEARSLHALLHPTFDPAVSYEVIARGVAASPGAAKGAIVFTAPEAVTAAENGRDVILVRPFTEADDVAGFHAAKGILTSEGGKASHAALVARGMGRPAVTGAADLDIDLQAREVHVDGRVLREGDLIAIDGTAGAITLDDVPLVTPEVDPRFDTVLGWSTSCAASACEPTRTLPRTRAVRELRRRGHRAVPDRAHVHGRGPQPKMQGMIMADDDRAPRAASELLPLQQEDFEGCSRRWRACRSRSGCSTRRCMNSCPTARARGAVELRAWTTPSCGARDAPRACGRSEENPMLGTRGVRLGLLLPGDLRDAGPGDLPRAELAAEDAAPGDHDPARSLRPASSSCCAISSCCRRRGGLRRSVASSASAR